MARDIISTAEAAVSLGVSVRRVQAMIRAGRLKASRLGRDWLIERSALAEVRTRKPGRPSKALDR